MIEIACTPEEMIASSLGIEDVNSMEYDMLESSVVLDGVYSSIMYDTSLSRLWRCANCRAKILDAGPLCKPSDNPAPGEGAAIEIIPFINSDTTVCMAGSWSGDNKLTRRAINPSLDSHWVEIKLDTASWI